ncbi:MAG: hypothetical protein JWO32_1331 [Bacteroidetes bacterium]|nr:hypothetical protein [Bacteroidota bacterium]
MKPTPILAVSLGVVVVLFNGACVKNTECKATVHCVDSTGAPLKNTNVLLYAPVSGGSTGDVKTSGITDEKGDVRFTFKLPAIFDVKATAPSNSNTLTGTGLIRLEEGKGSEKTITLK